MIRTDINLFKISNIPIYPYLILLPNQSHSIFSIFYFVTIFVCCRHKNTAKIVMWLCLIFYHNVTPPGLFVSPPDKQVSLTSLFPFLKSKIVNRYSIFSKIHTIYIFLFCYFLPQPSQRDR